MPKYGRREAKELPKPDFCQDSGAASYTVYFSAVETDGLVMSQSIIPYTQGASFAQERHARPGKSQVPLGNDRGYCLTPPPGFVLLVWYSQATRVYKKLGY